MDKFQWYPTPKALAKRMWDKFKNAREITRVLDPSGGNGDLLLAAPWHEQMWRSTWPVSDACEINVERHAVMQDKNINVVGLDFLQMQSAAMYPAIIMNPPFKDGVHHVLKAWDILYDGEIVALVNAETILNPYSKERERLVDMVLKHGNSEIIEGAFEIEEAERKTPVTVALLYLRKEAEASELVGNLFESLREDKTQLGADYSGLNQLALPQTTIERAVLNFKAASQSMEEAVRAQARADYYSSLLGATMAEVVNGNSRRPVNTSVNYVRTTLAANYDKLKDAAWTAVLRSSDFQSRLSSKAQRRLESEFEKIKKLDFTLDNIYGFLLGIVESQGDIQIEMICDVFDEISRYYSDNTVYYRGWKSNDKHRTCGMRLKTTRFILPGNSSTFSSSLNWEAEQRLRDFDKVFAMLDGKVEPDVSLAWVFNESFDELRCGDRVSSSYFDVRFYQGVGTIHFFCTRKDLMDRLNRVVGQRRAWLPPEGEKVAKDFWVQYDNAEKYSREYEKEISKLRLSFWDHPLNTIHHPKGADTAKQVRAQQQFDQAMATVHEKHGLQIDLQIEDVSPDLLRLAA